MHGTTNNSGRWRLRRNGSRKHRCPGLSVKERCDESMDYYLYRLAVLYLFEHTPHVDTLFRLQVCEESRLADRLPRKIAYFNFPWEGLGVLITGIKPGRSYGKQPSGANRCTRG